MPSKSVLLDTCCFLNLCVSGYLAEALGGDDWSYALSGIAADEALYVWRENKMQEGGLEPVPVNSRALAASAGMRIVEVGEAAEITLYVRLAVILDDGEAHGLAVSKLTSRHFGTDDRKATRVALHPDVGVKTITTPEIVKHWLDARLVDAEPRVLLSNIERYGKFRPRTDSPLADWWAVNMV